MESCEHLQACAAAVEHDAGYTASLRDALVALHAKASLAPKAGRGPAAHCHRCSVGVPDLWMCLHPSCHQLRCGRNSNKHALTHYTKEESHAVCLNVGTQMIWCFACDDEIVGDLDARGAPAPESDAGGADAADPATSGKPGSVSASTIRLMLTEVLAAEASAEGTDDSDSDAGSEGGEAGGDGDDDDGGGEAAGRVGGDAAGAARPSAGAGARTKSGHGGGHMGLVNLGNTCYLNAALQAMSNVPPLSTYLCEHDLLSPIASSKPATLGHKFQALARSLWSTRRGATAPSEVLGELRRLNPRFRGFAQQDSHEATRLLLDELHTVLSTPVPRCVEPLRIAPGLRPAASDGAAAAAGTAPAPTSGDDDMDAGGDDDVGAGGGGDDSDVVGGDTRGERKRRRAAGTSDDSASSEAESAAQRARTRGASAMAATEADEALPDDTDGDGGAGSKTDDSRRTQVVRAVRMFADVVDGDAVAGGSDFARNGAGDAGGGEAKDAGGSVEAKDADGSKDDDATGDETPPTPVPPRRGTPLTTDDDYYKQSVVSDVFQGLIQSSVTCRHCNRASVTTDEFYDLSLSIPRRAPAGSRPAPARYGMLTQVACFIGRLFWSDITIEDCVYAFCAPDRLSGSNQYYCEHCKARHDADKQIRLLRLPEVLCLQLKRFRFDQLWSSKVGTRVAFPLDGLDMSRFVAPSTVFDNSNSTYDCVSVVRHIGSFYGGHYIAYGRNKASGEWLKFDDSRVSRSSEGTVEKTESYMLFYQRRRPDTPLYAQVCDTIETALARAVAASSDRGDAKDSDGAGAGTAAGAGAGAAESKADDVYCYVSKYWAFKARHLADAGPATAADVLCRDHGLLRPPLAARADEVLVALTRAEWDVVLRRSQGAAACLRSTKACHHCVRETAEWAKLREEDRDRVPKLDAIKCEDAAGDGNGPCWCIVSNVWLTRWQQFVFSELVDDGTGRGTSPPGPIDNTDLLDDEGEPLKGLRPSKYRGLNVRVWNYLTARYGEKGQTILRAELNLYGKPRVLGEAADASGSDSGSDDDDRFSGAEGKADGSGGDT